MAINKLFIIMFVLILLTGLSSAVTYKTFNPNDGNFGSYTIEQKKWYDLFGWGKEETKYLKLNLNTDPCSNDCLALMDVHLKKDGPIFDSLEWRRSFNNQKTWQEWNGFTNWKIYYREEKTEEWLPYDFQELPKGKYEIKITGGKKPSTILDWIPMIEKASLNDWAIWGSMGLQVYDEINDSFVNQTLWHNITAGGGTTTEDTIKMTLDSSVATSGCATGSKSSNITSILLPESVEMLNFSVKLAGDHYWASPSSSSKGYIINVFGEDLINTGSDLNTYFNYTIYKNITLGSNNYSVYNNSVFVKNIVATNWNITIDTWAWANAVSCSGSDSWAWSKAELYFVNYIGGSSVILNSPADNHVSSTHQITFNATAEVIGGANLVNMSLWTNESGWSIKNTTTITGTTNTSIFINTIQEGYTLWNIEACDSDGDCGFSLANYTIALDTTSPTILMISGNETNSYGGLTINHSLNYSITDPELDSCWLEYNNINTSLPCTSGDYNTSSFGLIYNLNNATIYANDSVNNVGSFFFDWAYYIFENSRSYPNSTLFGETETFLINVTSLSALSSSSLYLNNISYPADWDVIGSDNIVNATFSIPGTPGNLSWFWNFVLSDSTNVNSSESYLLVNNFTIDDCSAYQTLLFNLTSVDEELQTIIPNSTIDIAVNIYSSGKGSLIQNYSSNFTDINPVAICLSQNFSDSTSYVIDTIIRYTSSEHATEYYNIFNGDLLDVIGTNITLYDLNLSDSTEFQLTFIGESFLPVEDALIYIERQYIPENTFKVVELPKTDSNGQTIVHLVRNDVIYNMRIVKDGVILANFENIIAFCEDYSIGNCKLSLNAYSSSDHIFNQNNFTKILMSDVLFDNATRKVSFSFTTYDGTSRAVVMEVTRNDIFGNSSLCNASITASSGTPFCIIPSGLDDTYIITKIYVDGDLVMIDNVRIDSTGYGAGGYLIFFVFILSMVLLFSESKTLMLVGLLIGFIGAIGFGIITSDLIGLGASGLWLMIIIVIAIWKLNKGRTQ